MKVIASVPVVVIGLPVMVNPVGTVMATDDTVPDPVPKVAMDPSDFFRNSTPSARLQASSPVNRSPVAGTLLAVVVDLGFIGLAIHHLRMFHHL